MMLAAAAMFAMVWTPAAQESEALRALIDLPGVSVAFEFNPETLDTLLVGDRLAELRAKGDVRTLGEDLELIHLTKEYPERKAVAEAALRKETVGGDRLTLLLSAGRLEDATAFASQVPPVGLESLRGRLALAGADLDTALANALGPLGMDSIRQNPLAIVAAGRLLGKERDAALDAIEAAKREIDGLAPSIAALREAAPSDARAYRLWLAARNAQVLAEVALGLLGPPIPDPLAGARTKYQGMQRESFGFAKETGELRAMIEAVMAGLVYTAGGGAVDEAFEKDLRAQLADVGALAASRSEREQLATHLVDGAMRFAILWDGEGALKSLTSAWKLAGTLPDVRKSIAGPIVILQMEQKAWDAGLAFLGEAREFLGATISLQLEAKFSFAKNDLDGTISALARLQDPETALWSQLAGAAVYARRTKEPAGLKQISEAFTLPLAIAFAGKDQALQADALLLAGLLAGLSGDRDRAMASAAMLRIREGGSDRVVAFEKALGVGPSGNPSPRLRGEGQG